MQVKSFDRVSLIIASSALQQYKYNLTPDYYPSHSLLHIRSITPTIYTHYRNLLSTSVSFDSITHHNIMYSNAFSNIVTLGLLAAPVLAFPTERVAEVTSLEKRTNWHWLVISISLVKRDFTDYRNSTYPETYTITNQTAVYATPELISGVLVQGPGTIASGYTYSKGYTYTAGISASWTM